MVSQKRKPSISMAGREPTPAERAAPQKLAELAVAKVLRRIGEDADVGYHLGSGTETLALLLRTYAALTGRDAVAVEDEVRDAWAKNDRKSAREQLDAIVVVAQRALVALKQLDEDNFYRDERAALSKALEEARAR